MLTATVLAGAATFPMAGVALAQDRDCPDFTSQQDAQAALDTSPYDDELLDADGDRIACENHFDDGYGNGGDDPDDSAGTSAGTNAGSGGDTSDSDDGEPPVGPVETGAGSTADDRGAAAPLALAGASTLVIAGMLVAALRSGRQRG